MAFATTKRPTFAGISWPCILAALLASITATPTAHVVAQTAPTGNNTSVQAAQRPPAHRRLPQGYTPKTLQTRWNPQAAANGNSTSRTVTTSTTPTGLSTAQRTPGTPALPTVARRATNTQPIVTVSNSEPAKPATVMTEALEPLDMMASPAPTGQQYTTLPAPGEMISDPAATTICDDGTWGDGIPQPPCGGSMSGIHVLPGIAIDHFTLFGGIHGAKSSANRGQDGSFGFHEGFNIGTGAKNIIFPEQVGLQFGLQAAHSNLDGAAFTLQERNQIFVTTGAFRRADHGLQGGLVFDYMWDDWYYDLQVGQVRGEVSMALSDRNSYGGLFTTSVSDDTSTSRIFGPDVTERWETMDVYALFYRTQFVANGTGEARVFAGFTGASDGIIGADSTLPLMNGWALETGFTYLVPDETTGFGANEVESWNLAINLAWYPGALACGDCYRYHRPLFPVAGNGSMILRRR